MNTGKKVKPKPQISIPTPCTDPCCCADQPCGTMFYCEDGVCTPIPPPTYFAVLVFDPQRPGCSPYWERPENV